MKLSSYLFLSLAALAGLASCSSDADSPSQRGGSGSPVVVKAAVGAGSIYTRTNPVGTEAQQTAFNTGDQISLTDLSNPGGEKTVNYQLDAEGWSPITAGEYLTWHSATQRFRAFYPVKVQTANATTSETLDLHDSHSNSFDVGYVADDQRLLAALQSSDFMKVQNDLAVKEPTTHVLPLEFTRQTARIVVNVIGYNDQYSAETNIVQGVVINAADNTSSTSTTEYIDAYEMPGESISAEGVLQQFVGLVCPTDKKDDTMFLRLYVAEKGARVDYQGYNSAPGLNVTGIPAIEAGKSYTYNVTLGKNTVKVSSVTVADWGEESLLPSSGYADRNRTPYDFITKDNLGWVLTSEGIPFATAEEATAVGAHPVAMIAYVGYDTGDNTYKNGLAIALNDYETINDEGNVLETFGYWWFDGADELIDNVNDPRDPRKEGVRDFLKNSVHKFVDDNKIPSGCGKWRVPTSNDVKHIIASFGGTPYEKGAVQSGQHFDPGTFLDKLNAAGSKPMEAAGQHLMLLGDGRKYGVYYNRSDISPARETWLANFDTSDDTGNAFWKTSDWNSRQYNWDSGNQYPRASRLVFPF